MSDSGQNRDENPLDDLAAGMSDSATGKNVTLQSSSAMEVDAGQVQMQQSSAGKIKAHAVRIENSAAGFVRAGTVDAHDSAVGMAAARNLHMKESASPFLVAGSVEADEVNSVFLAAGRVRGTVHTVFTLWTALAAGLGMGAALFGLRTWLGGRDKTAR